MKPRAPSGYRHSQVFSVLKTTEETISDNLTTPQYLRTLDDLLDNALVPILTETTYVESFLSALLGWQELNFRRKVSFRDRGYLYSHALLFLSSVDDKVAAFKKLKLERGIRLRIVKTFLSTMEELHSVHTDTKADHWLTVNAHYTAAFGCESLLPVIREAGFWLGRAEEFKRRILQKYFRLTLNVAQSDYVSFFECRGVDLDDMIQVYLLAASRGIDKCDQDQGALTSHLSKWFLTARLRVSQQRDRASSHALLENISVQDLDPSLVNDQEPPDPTVVRVLARLADPLGAARLALGIEEHLTDKEIEQPETPTEPLPDSSPETQLNCGSTNPREYQNG